MMTKTEAYPLIDHDYFDIFIELPVGATIVGVDLGEEHPELLVQNHRASEETETRLFRLYNDGEELQLRSGPRESYVGTVEVHDGPIHIYEVQVH